VWVGYVQSASGTVRDVCETDSMEEALSEARQYRHEWSDSAGARRASAEAPNTATREAVTDALQGGGGNEGKHIRHQMMVRSALGRRKL